jgi:prevent-host-death family protein
VEWTPSRKGAIAETAIAAAATELGIDVYRPVVEGGRCDLIFDTGPRLLRVQCKWAIRRGAVLGVKIGTSRLTPAGYIRTTYSAAEIDAVAAYSQELKRCFLLPISLAAGRSVIHLRLDPAKNGQEGGINYARDYELGAIAQLGERSAGSRKVGGSNPPSSTPRANRSVAVSAHDFRERFGLYLEQAAAGSPIVITRYGKPYARLVPSSA